MAIISDVVFLILTSPKRNFVLNSSLGRDVSSPCQTRCIERHDSVIQVKRDFQSIAKAMEEEVSERTEHISSSKASVNQNVCDCDLNCDVISGTEQLSTNKRNKNVKTDTAKLSSNFLEDTLTIDRRNNVDSIVDLIFNAVLKQELGVPDKEHGRGSHLPSFLQS